MALTYIQRKTLAANQSFLDRLAMAINSAAIAIAQDTPSAAIDIRRDKYARQVLHNLDQATTDFAKAVSNQFAAKTATDGSDISDAELDTAVAAVWNDEMVS